MCLVTCKIARILLYSRAAKNKVFRKIGAQMLKVSNVMVLRQERPLLEPLTFQLAPGQAAHLVASNGTGKSTLLKAFLGHYPFSGQIDWKGMSLLRQLDEVHILPHGDILFPYLTVKQQLEYWAGVFKGAFTDFFWDLFDAFGLSSYLELPVQSLSEGQARKLALCSLLISNRPLWLLDEPLTSLDAVSQTIFLEEARNHLNNNGVIVAASHQSLPCYFQKIDLEPLC